MRFSPLLLLGVLPLASARPTDGPGKPHPWSFHASAPAPTGLPALYLGRPRLLLTRLDERHVRLRWAAVPETNTQGYWVERSSDSDHWLRHAFVPLSSNHRYHFVDTTARAVYYRVVRLERTQLLSASPAVRSSYGVPLGPLLASPNPARGPVHLLGWDPGLLVDVLNGRGETVHQVFDSSFTTAGLRPGVYALRQGRQVTRLIVR